MPGSSGLQSCNGRLLEGYYEKRTYGVCWEFPAYGGLTYRSTAYGEGNAILIIHLAVIHILTRHRSLAQTPRGRLPGPGTVIASSHTSPLDILYLAAIFDPIFTQSQPGSRLVRPVCLEAALAGCFDIQLPPPFSANQNSIELSQFIKQNPNRVVVVFPESTTSNGRGILKLSPSLLSASKLTKIFPVSLRYTPPDIVTPIPGWLEAIRFIWRLNSSPTHCIRVRIGAPLTIASPPAATTSTSSSSPGSAAKTRTGRSSTGRDGFETNFFDTLDSSSAQKVAGDSESDDQDGLDPNERNVLDAVADALARLGRVKRVGLGVDEKSKFVDAWWKGRKARR